MKTKLSFLVLALGIFLSQVNAANDVASFETGATDLFTSFSEGLQIVNNPSPSVLNTSEKAIKNTRPQDQSWTESVRLYSSSGNPIAISSSNRYLHIMVFSPNAADGQIFLQSGSGTNQWDYETKDVRFSFAAGQWKDIVFDLNSKSVSSLYGFYFLSQDWDGAPSERNFYYDEIVLNDDSSPRTPKITTASMLADFEDDGISPSFSDDGSVLAEKSINSNPDKTGLNKTNKSLYAKTKNSSGDWWGGIKINFDTPVLVGDATRYFHIFVKTELPKFEFDFFAGGEEWAGTTSVATQDWTEYVVDLYNIKGSISKKDKLLEGVRVALSLNEAAQRDKTIYIDEILINGDPTPREAGPLTGLKNQNTKSDNIRITSTGLFVQGDINDLKVYDMQGSLVQQISSTKDVSVNLERGLYIIMLNGELSKIVIN